MRCKCSIEFARKYLYFEKNRKFYNININVSQEIFNQIRSNGFEYLVR